MKEWLKPPYHIRSRVLEDSKPGGPLSQEAANVLLGVHERDINDNPPRQSPSNQDIQLLKDRYGIIIEYNNYSKIIIDTILLGSRRSDSCNVLGPPAIGVGEATHTQGS